MRITVRSKHLPQAFPWQHSALDLWLRSCRGIVAAVTGAGKTTFALLCIEAWLERHPDGITCIIVPTIALLDQWVISLTEDFGVEERDIASIAAGSRHVDEAKFIIAVINSARRFSQLFSPAGPTMLIVDECHRAGSPENARALAGNWTATLGLSATPEREYDDGYYRYVAPALGAIIYRYDYAQAFSDGVIVPFDLVNIHFDLTTEEETEYSRLSRLIAIRSRSTASVDSEGLEVLLRRRARVSWNSGLRIPLAAKLVLDNRGKRVIVFHESVKAANQIHAILERRGVMVTLYHTGLAPLRRRENLRQFRRGFYSCLVCCRALDEGLNVPDASVAIIASGTASIRQRIQRLGRVLRRQARKSNATIYTCFGTDTEKQRLAIEEGRLEGVASVRWLHAGVPVG